MEEQITRKVSRIGNGAHIFVPREWINEIVYITKPKISIKEKIYSLLSQHLEDIEGIYLYGSYAREEHNSNSDIDLLIISSKKIKIKEKNIEIIVLDRNKIEDAIKINPVLIYSILNESKPIMNSKLIDTLKQNYKPQIKDFKEVIYSTKRIVKINRDLLISEEDVSSASYSIILRLRGVYIIKQILLSKQYTNKEFKNWIKDNCPKVDLNSVYYVYNEIKSNKKSSQIIKKNDLIELLNLLEKETDKLESRIKNDK